MSARTAELARQRERLLDKSHRLRLELGAEASALAVRFGVAGLYAANRP